MVHTPETTSEPSFLCSVQFQKQGFLNSRTASKASSLVLFFLSIQTFHPSESNVLEESTPETISILRELSERYSSWQRIKPGPIRFRVSFGAEDVLFYERIIIDILYIEHAPVLHILNEENRFWYAQFQLNVGTNAIWDTLVRCRYSTYTFITNRILLDQNSWLWKRELFISLSEIYNVNVEWTGIQAHSSLNVCERYH